MGYQIRDINLGTDVAAAAQATVDIAWDMANKVDFEAYTMMTGGQDRYRLSRIFGPFNLTRASLWTGPGFRIAASCRPTCRNERPGSDGQRDRRGPEQPVPAERAPGDHAVLRAVGEHLGHPDPPDGLIYVPSIDVTDLASEITPTWLIFPNAVAEGLLQNYTQFDYMGVRWTLVPDVTLPPGHLLPGAQSARWARCIYKPSFDEEFVDTNRRKNWETRSARR